MARKKTSIDAPVYYTTHQVAKHLGVSLPTVVNWVNAGRLRAHRTPGGHRRIAHHDVISFAREHDYPVARELLQNKAAHNKILIVDDEQDFSEMVREYLCARGSFEVEVANSGFRAGYVLARFKPDLILLDLLMPDLDGLEVRKALRQEPETRHVSIIATSSDSGSDSELHEQHYEGYVEKPLVLDKLLDLIRSALRENE